MHRAAPRTSAPPESTTTRARILEAARVLFERHGYAGTSVRLIARHLGITDPGVYYYFRSKREIYQQLLVKPDYGELPLDSVPLSRATLIDQAAHIFGWWAVRVEHGRMALREQLEGDEASVGYLEIGVDLWNDAVTKPLRTLVGEAALETSETLFDLFCGFYWDAILVHGDETARFLGSDEFTNRLRFAIDLCIPGPRLAAR